MFNDQIRKDNFFFNNTVTLSLKDKEINNILSFYYYYRKRFLICSIFTVIFSLILLVLFLTCSDCEMNTSNRLLYSVKTNSLVYNDRFLIKSSNNKTNIYTFLSDRKNDINNKDNNINSNISNLNSGDYIINKNTNNSISSSSKTLRMTQENNSSSASDSDSSSTTNEEKNSKLNTLLLENYEFFIVYCELAFSILLFITTIFLFFCSNKNEYSSAKSITSTILQLILNFQIYSFCNYLNWKYEISQTYYRISYLFLLIENIIKIGYLLFIDNYFLFYLISNMLYVIFFFLAENLIVENGYLNLISETLNILIISFIVYWYNHQSFSKMYIEKVLIKYFSKIIGSIKINLKEKKTSIDSSIYKYLKQNNFNIYIEKPSNNSINYIDDNSEAYSQIKMDKKTLTFILENIQFDPIIEPDIRILFNEFQLEEDSFQKDLKIYALFDRIVKIGIQNDYFQNILGIIELNHGYLQRHPHHKLSNISSNSNFPVKIIKNKIREKNNEVFFLNVVFHIIPHTHELHICLAENPNYNNELKKEFGQLTESLLYLSKITHEFKSPLTTIDCLLDNISNSLLNKKSSSNQFNLENGIVNDNNNSINNNLNDMNNMISNKDSIKAFNNKLEMNNMLHYCYSDCVRRTQKNIYELSEENRESNVQYKEKDNLKNNDDKAIKSKKTMYYKASTNINNYYNNSNLCNNYFNITSNDQLMHILENQYTFSPQKMNLIMSDIKKVKSLSSFIIILFKDLEYLSSNLTNSNSSMKEKQKLNFFKSSVDLKEVFIFAKDILETRNSQLSKDIKIKTSFDSSLPKFIETDEIRLKQVLTNLLSNAIKFTRKGEIKLLFRNILNAKTKKRYVEFIVQDTGKGISNTKIKQILSNDENNNINDVFWKEMSNENKLGSGLGLNIVKDILKNIGEKFNIESIMDSGTKFSFLINYNNGSPNNSNKTIENNTLNNTGNKSLIKIKAEGIHANNDLDNNNTSNKNILLSNNNDSSLGGVHIDNLKNNYNAMNKFNRNNFQLYTNKNTIHNINHHKDKQVLNFLNNQEFNSNSSSYDDEFSKTLNQHELDCLRKNSRKTYKTNNSRKTNLTKSINNRSEQLSKLSKFSEKVIEKFYNNNESIERYIDYCTSNNISPDNVKTNTCFNIALNKPKQYKENMYNEEYNETYNNYLTTNRFRSRQNLPSHSNNYITEKNTKTNSNDIDNENLNLKNIAYTPYSKVTFNEIENKRNSNNNISNISVHSFNKKDDKHGNANNKEFFFKDINSMRYSDLQSSVYDDLQSNLFHFNNNYNNDINSNIKSPNFVALSSNKTINNKVNDIPNLTKYTKNMNKETNNKLSNEVDDSSDIMIKKNNNTKILNNIYNTDIINSKKNNNRLYKKNSLNERLSIFTNSEKDSNFRVNTNDDESRTVSLNIIPAASFNIQDYIIMKANKKNERNEGNPNEDLSANMKFRNSYTSNFPYDNNKDFNFKNFDDAIGSYKRHSAQPPDPSQFNKISPIKSILLQRNKVSNNSKAQLIKTESNNSIKNKKTLTFRQPSVPTRKSKSTIDVNKESLPRVCEVNSEAELLKEATSPEKTEPENLNVSIDNSIKTKRLSKNSIANFEMSMNKSKKFNTSKKLIKKDILKEYYKMESETDSNYDNNKERNKNNILNKISAFNEEKSVNGSCRVNINSNINNSNFSSNSNSRSFNIHRNNSIKTNRSINNDNSQKSSINKMVRKNYNTHHNNIQNNNYNAKHNTSNIRIRNNFISNSNNSNKNVHNNALITNIGFSHRSKNSSIMKNINNYNNAENMNMRAIDNRETRKNNKFLSQKQQLSVPRDRYLSYKDLTFLVNQLVNIKNNDNSVSNNYSLTKKQSFSLHNIDQRSINNNSLGGKNGNNNNVINPLGHNNLSNPYYNYRQINTTNLYNNKNINYFPCSCGKDSKNNKDNKDSKTTTNNTYNNPYQYLKNLNVNQLSPEDFCNTCHGVIIKPYTYKILVVDDESLFRINYRNSLQKYAVKNDIKIEIDLASNGLQAMIQIFKRNKEPYDAIIVDHNMEHLKGNEIGYILRSSLDNNKNNTEQSPSKDNKNQKKTKTSISSNNINAAYNNYSKSSTRFPGRFKSTKDLVDCSDIENKNNMNNKNNKSQNNENTEKSSYKTIIFLATGEFDNDRLMNYDNVKVIDYLLTKHNFNADAQKVMSVLLKEHSN